MLSQSIFGILNILFGCCINVLSLELIILYNKSSGFIITFLQFSYIILVSLVNSKSFSSWSKECVDNNKLSKAYFKQSIVHYFVSIANNIALNFNISMPLHMIFRSSSIVAALLLGTFMHKQNYTLYKWVGCILISIGIFITTLADAIIRGKIHFSFNCCSFDISNWYQNNNNNLIVSGDPLYTIFPSLEVLFPNELPDLSKYIDPIWGIGILILTCALIMSAELGFMQEKVRHFKRPWQESLLYTHLICFPAFLFYYDEIVETLFSWYSNPYFHVQFMGYDITMSIFLAAFLNVSSQYICIRDASNTLTTTVVLTIRKFVSLIFSIVYFNNPFTPMHWVGTILVFGGSMIYSLWKPSDKEVKTTEKKLN